VVDLCKDRFAEYIEPGDELDFDDDEYADNENASYSFAVVSSVRQWYDAAKDPWITLVTSQGSFDMPAGHYVKIKVDS
jgi:hypothetical protein